MNLKTQPPPGSRGQNPEVVNRQSAAKINMGINLRVDIENQQASHK
jgi:hypothetical protein